MNTSQKVTCCGGCAQSLRGDDACHLIYGPFVIDGRPVGRLEWAAYADECIYCGARLPRGRALRLRRELAAARRERLFQAAGLAPAGGVA